MIILLVFLLVLEIGAFKLATSPAKFYTIPKVPKPHFITCQNQRRVALSSKIPHDHSLSGALFASSSEEEDAPVAEIIVPLINGEEQKATSSSARSLLEKIDVAGLKLKSKAVEARDKAIEIGNKDKIFSFLYTAKACSLIGLFIIYRAYRGFFVVLPAVFGEVYKKLETAVESPFDPSIDPSDQDVDPVTGKLRSRSRFVVSLLASMVTASYVVSGAFRVLMKFVRSIIATSSVEKSFEAAADEVMVNEKQIMKLAKGKSTIGTPASPDENGSATLRP